MNNYDAWLTYDREGEEAEARYEAHENHGGLAEDLEGCPECEFYLEGPDPDMLRDEMMERAGGDWFED